METRSSSVLGSAVGRKFDYFAGEPRAELDPAGNLRLKCIGSVCQPHLDDFGKIGAAEN